MVQLKATLRSALQRWVGEVVEREGHDLRQRFQVLEAEVNRLTSQLEPQDLRRRLDSLQADLDRLAAALERLEARPAPPIQLGDGELLVSTPRFTLCVPGWDLSLAPAILLHRSWEPELSDHLAARLVPGDIALDVGANLGWFSCLFASRGAVVHAFEPNPRLQRILRKNVFLNAGSRTRHCSVNPVAVSDTTGEVEMRFPHWLVGGAGLYDFNHEIFLDSLIPEPVPVPLISLDAFAAARGISDVRLIKVDVEGEEERVVRGALELLRGSSRPVLAIEYTRGRYSREFPALLFHLFARAHAPVIDQAVDQAFLEAYEAGALLPDTPLLDLVFEHPA